MYNAPKWLDTLKIWKHLFTAKFWSLKSVFVYVSMYLYMLICFYNLNRYILHELLLFLGCHQQDMYFQVLLMTPKV